jgi:hypothetical protein
LSLSGSFTFGGTAMMTSCTYSLTATKQ